MIARGLRNNNPGNLRPGREPWLGQSAQQGDPDFLVFATPEFGLRALIRTLCTYRTAHGCRTVRALISRWAPATENDTEAYVQAVARHCGVGPDAEIEVFDPRTMTALVEAIIRRENGVQPYAPELIARALALAGLGGPPSPPASARLAA